MSHKYFGTFVDETCYVPSLSLLIMKFLPFRKLSLSVINLARGSRWPSKPWVESSKIKFTCVFCRVFHEDFLWWSLTWALFVGQWILCFFVRNGISCKLVRMANILFICFVLFNESVYLSKHFQLESFSTARNVFICIDAICYDLIGAKLCMPCWEPLCVVHLSLA